MIDLERLYKLTFTKQLVDDSTEYASKLLSVKAKKKVPKQSPREAYIHIVLDSFSELSKIAENLDYCEIFLKSYFVSKAWRNKYDKNHYITYHYEMWVINSIRFYERMLILIDSVYDLEIDHRDVSYKSISAHEGLTGSDTLKVLNRIHAALSPLQGLKNQVFHRYIYTDKEIGDISMHEFLGRNSKKDDAKKFKIYAKIKMSIYVAKKREEVNKNNKALIDAAEALIKTLDIKYIAQRDSLSNTIEP